MSTEITLDGADGPRFKTLEVGAVFSALNVPGGYIYVKNSNDAITNCVAFSKNKPHPFIVWIGPDQRVLPLGTADDYVFSVAPKTKEK